MNRRMLVLFAGLTISAIVAVAGHPVMTHDGVVIEDAQTTTAANGAIWVRAGLGAPIQAAPNPQGEIHLPQLLAANYVILDSASGEPVTHGALSWLISGAPEAMTEGTWAIENGHLDFTCLGNEKVVFSAPGYASTTTRLEADGRRHTVLMRPRAALTIELEPANEAWMWLAQEDRINVTSLFVSVSQKHQIGSDGIIELPDLDREASYVGVVVPKGKAPVHGSFQNLPKKMRLPLEEGLSVGGFVRDTEGNPIPGARIDVMGEIAELDNFRYHQKDVGSDDGSFNVSGMLPGEVRVRACADRRACSEVAVDLAPGKTIDPVSLELAPGRDLVLVVENQVRDRIADAMVYFDDRLHYTDERGELRIEGVTNRATIPVTIFGSGFGMWEGSFTADRARVVITVPGGAVIEQQVLSAARFDEHEVVVRWQAYTDTGREGKSGQGHWDRERGIARAEGLEAGTYALSVRLPRSSTLTSERVEVAIGEEVILPPVVPDRGLAISGRVLDAETLQPVPGAQVSCEPGTPSVFRAPHVVENVPSILTDTDGVFLLEGLDPGSCRAIVRAAGFATWRLDGVEPDEIGFDIGDVEVDAGMTVVGRVYDRMDRPITGAVVEITEAASYAYFAEATVRTDHNGYFRAERLPVGRWKLAATHGQETAREIVEGEAWETVEVDLMLGGIRVEGEVWLGDQRAAGGTLVLTTEGAQAPGVVVMMQRVTADRQFFGIDQQPMQFMVSGDGRFAGSGLSPGRYYASYTPVGGGSAPITKILDVPHVESFQCAIQYSDATIEGFVIDTDGQPVAGASVLASAGDGIQDATAFTDADGRFSVRGLEPGRLVLTANHTDFAPSDPSEFELRTGSVEGPVVLELLPHDGANIMLSVNTVAGSSGGAPVYLVGPETSTGFTDGGGLATFSGIQAGSYRPCGIAYGGATGCGPNLLVDNGEQVEAHLDLGQGGFVDIYLGDGRSSASSVKGVAMATIKRAPSVRVMTADGVDLSSLLFMANPPQTTAGGLRIGPLQADDYVISVGTASGSLQGQVTVVDGAPTELDLS